MEGFYKMTEEEYNNLQYEIEQVLCLGHLHIYLQIFIARSLIVNKSGSDPWCFVQIFRPSVRLVEFL